MTVLLSPLAALIASIGIVLPAIVVSDGLLGILYLITVGLLLFFVSSSMWLVLAIETSGTRRLAHALGFLMLFPVPIATLVAPATAITVGHDVLDLVLWRFAGSTDQLRGRLTAEPGLPHAFWRVSGMLVSFVETYLVFDEADTLAAFAYRGGKVPGVPCGVWHVLPLQRHWYAVTLYSQQTWDECM